MLYRHALKPILFQFDPEFVHDRFTAIGQLLGGSTPLRAATRALSTYEHPMLHTTVAGMHFANPIGLAAGFDKNAHLTDILPAVGFGFAELGSITGKPCPGNPRPRLWRLPQSEALVVYYGLKNDGADAVAARLRGRSFAFPVGISAAKTNDRETCDTDTAVADYTHVVRTFADIGDYFTINISCPNTYGGEPFTDPARLDALLTSVDAVAQKPVFLKLAVDLSPAQVDAILTACESHRIAGLVCSNLTKNRANHRIKDAHVPEKGGISGRAVQQLADEQLRYIAKHTQQKYVLIGVGGVFTAEDAYRKIRLGASLVQLITGMIFRGPQAIGQINRGLVQLLQRDGFSSVSEAVGADVR